EFFKAFHDGQKARQKLVKSFLYEAQDAPAPEQFNIGFGDWSIEAEYAFDSHGSGGRSTVMGDAEFSVASCPVSDLRGLRGSLSPPQHKSPQGPSPDSSGEPLVKQ
ncbi:unnamed protein product, partial [Symbiodinium sp. KB8]